MDDLDDAAIERSIAEINEAIRRSAARKSLRAMIGAGLRSLLWADACQGTVRFLACAVWATLGHGRFLPIPPRTMTTFVRTGNRAANQLRPVRITRHYTMHAEGSVLIEFGNTKVLCTARSKNACPRTNAAAAKAGSRPNTACCRAPPTPAATAPPANNGPHAGDPAPHRPQPARRV